MDKYFLVIFLFLLLSQISLSVVIFKQSPVKPRDIHILLMCSVNGFTHAYHFKGNENKINKSCLDKVVTKAELYLRVFAKLLNIITKLQHRTRVSHTAKGKCLCSWGLTAYLLFRL